jgi:hypothetical protein
MTRWKGSMTSETGTMNGRSSRDIEIFTPVCLLIIKRGGKILPLSRKIEDVLNTYVNLFLKNFLYSLIRLHAQLIPW